MTIAAPPRPPELDEPPDGDALEALIEEARRRARRRRQARAASALLVTAAGAAVFLSFHHGGGGAGDAAVGSESPSEAISRTGNPVSPIARGGQLTILAPSDLASDSTGWYELFTLASGRLRPFIRCPNRA